MADPVIGADVVSLIRLRPTCDLLTPGDIYRRADEHPDLAPRLAADLREKQTPTRRKVGMFLKRSAEERDWISMVPGCSRTNPQYKIVMDRLPGV